MTANEPSLGWSTQEIRDLCTLINGRGFKPFEWSNRGLPIIRIQNLNGSNEFNHYDGSFDPKILVQHGDLLFAWSGSRGASFGPHIWPGGDAVLNYHTWKVVPKSSVTPSFLYHALRGITPEVEASAHGASALVHVQKWEMEARELLVPPMREQAAITEALADADNLIATLERFIAKKQAIKQGMMQQLLTGRTRLPGFTDPWMETRLETLGRCIRGVGYNPDADLSPGDRPFTARLLRSNNVQNGRIERSGLQYVHERRVSAAQVLKFGDIVICMANGSRALVGKAALFEESAVRRRYTFGAFMGAFRTDRSMAVPKFVSEMMHTHAFRNWLDIILSGSSINNLRPGDVEGFAARVPGLAEQQAIADMLGDADTEIDVARERLAKARAIKTGMMQQLLTGRTRISISEVAA